MNGMATEDYYDVWLDMVGRSSRPRFRELLLSRAGVEIDPGLAQYLVTIGMRGPIGVLELAGILDENHPKASRSLTRLEQLGLVSRAEADRDRRIKTAALTPAGRRVVEQINSGRRRVLDEALADWSEADRAALTRLTRRFSDAMFALVEAMEPTRRATGQSGADEG